MPPVHRRDALAASAAFMTGVALEPGRTSAASGADDDLEAAAAGEKLEWTTLYADFAKTAKDEGFPDVARSFEQIGKVEKFHEARYRKLINNIASAEVFKKKASVKWHCINCGYVIEGPEAPKECPACKHPQSYYELLAENY